MPDIPAAPDFNSVVNQQGQNALANTRAATAANRVNQYGPDGSIVYSQDVPPGVDAQGNPYAGNPDQWSVTTNLSPGQQQLHDTNQATGLRAAQGVQGLFANPNLDLSGVTARTLSPGQTSQNALLSRLGQPVETRL